MSRRATFDLFEMRKHGQTTVAVAECSKCSREHEISQQRGGNVEHNAKRMERLGWKRKGQAKWICAYCVNERADARKQEEEEPVASNKVTELPTPSKAGQAGTVKAIRLLVAHFDEDKGTYEEPWSDEKIASDTGIAEAAVARIRREEFGELSEDPELTKLKADVAEMQEWLDDLKRRVDTYAKRRAL